VGDREGAIESSERRVTRWFLPRTSATNTQAVGAREGIDRDE
jgi:hypothetical protein